MKESSKPKKYLGVTYEDQQTQKSGKPPGRKPFVGLRLRLARGFIEHTPRSLSMGFVSPIQNPKNMGVRKGRFKKGARTPSSDAFVRGLQALFSKRHADEASALLISLF